MPRRSSTVNQLPYASPADRILISRNNETPSESSRDIACWPPRAIVEPPGSSRSWCSLTAPSHRRENYTHNTTDTLPLGPETPPRDCHANMGKEPIRAAWASPSLRARPEERVGRRAGGGKCLGRVAQVPCLFAENRCYEVLAASATPFNRRGSSRRDKVEVVAFASFWARLFLAINATLVYPLPWGNPTPRFHGRHTRLVYILRPLQRRRRVACVPRSLILGQAVLN
ncbi:hypothetical protein B0T26DRAFT_186469 [Lasiosphaeria miniovina]|uniref:Uncharacterized protein n=1 Tax=Lasiosphaeria miniovina TaxID=1954250 RepID=A0AA40B769_9PEZI|nr:uncharacterized protein B0T26DRAFT_186469 [Lasiosphaeria miniovina]KAK0728852.1 hypothetical protein B0T26DRAFT_186469 [Lasiosphaeria miniovina]